MKLSRSVFKTFLLSLLMHKIFLKFVYLHLNKLTFTKKQAKILNFFKHKFKPNQKMKTLMLKIKM